MTLRALQLRISTPTEPIPHGRGFYQLEEDTLYVQVGAFDLVRRFYSYLESDTLKLQFDRSGRLIFFALSVARRHWPVDEMLTLPDSAGTADVRWLDFRERIAEPTLQTNPRRTLLHLRFSDCSPYRTVHLADKVLLQADKNDRLVALWVDEVTDDLAGQEIAFFRKRLRPVEHEDDPLPTKR
jgi:hypothetical protein